MLNGSNEDGQADEAGGTTAAMDTNAMMERQRAVRKWSRGKGGENQRLVEAEEKFKSR